jgi:hypothetical protein
MPPTRRRLSGLRPKGSEYKCAPPTATPALKRIWRRHETLVYRDTTYGELDPGKQAAMTRNGVNVCPEAWHLQRRGTAQNVTGVRNLERGTFAHRRIGSRADRLRGLERLRRVTLLLLAVLLAGLVLQFFSAGGLVRP